MGKDPEAKKDDEETEEISGTVNALTSRAKPSAESRRHEGHTVRDDLAEDK